MRLSSKSAVTISLFLTSFVLFACSGLPKSSTGGGGGGPFTVGGSVSGLAGSGLVLADNGTDKLTVSANGTSAFATTVAKGGSYAVTVQTQPSNPTQTCAASPSTASGSNISANVTVTVSCTTNPVTATIGGTVSGLVVPGSSVILQNNGGDSLTVTANGPFVFKTPVTGADIYAVTVVTQPVNPNQICTVTNGSGTATANVTNVAVNCVLSFSIGGTVTGVVGTGLILQNSSDSEQLPISPANGNQAFTFKKLVPTGTVYNVTVFAQPTAPTQNCTVTSGTGSGTATANVTNVAIVCPAVTYSVGGTVVGLAGIPPNNGVLTDGSFLLQNNLGNTLNITENGPFTFATQEALNDQYQVSGFHAPSTQSQGCWLWNYKGVVTASVNTVVVDCGHNDWTWIDGTKTAGPIGAPQYGSFPGTAPTTFPNPFTNTPGARYGAAGWTDKSGNLWLFGGDGWELAGGSPQDTLNAPMNDLWVCVMVASDYCQWQLQGAYDPTVVNTVPPTTVGKQIIANAQHEGQGGVYGSPGLPPARLGAATWTDNTGNLWLFGGSDGSNYRNDLWEFNASTLTADFTAKAGQWTWVSGPSALDQNGIYPPTANPYPGARTNAVTWTDASGNFWLFGGFGKDGAGTLGFLNDLWENTGGVWTFVSGSSLANQIGIGYGTPGVASGTNVPGGRQEAVGWADAAGNLWLFGGEGEDGNTPPTVNGILDDLWVYNIA